MAVNNCLLLTEYLYRHVEAHYQQILVRCSNGTLCMLMEVYQFKRLIYP